MQRYGLPPQDPFLGCIIMKEQAGKEQVSSNSPPLAGLTKTQLLGLNDVLLDVRKADCWSWELPVLVRDRCWLRLDRIALSDLTRYLPPDGRDEAPELTHYRLLMAEGVDPLLAQQTCWQEFGMEDCQRALLAYWQSSAQTNHGWTASRYRQLVSRYRTRVERDITTVPMLVLARRESEEHHQIHWITDITRQTQLDVTRHC